VRIAQSSSAISRSLSDQNPAQSRIIPNVPTMGGRFAEFWSGLLNAEDAEDAEKENAKVRMKNEYQLNLDFHILHFSFFILHLLLCVLSLQ
jgi:hypothetical protein